MTHSLIKIHEHDNVAIALENIDRGEKVLCEDMEILIKTPVSEKHKVALDDFEKGSIIYMYGVIVGTTSQNIAKGEVLSVNNVAHKSAAAYAKQKSIQWQAPDVSKWKDRTFMGYHRSDGQVGTENIWLFFPLVFCENRNIQLLKDIFEKELYPQELSDHQLLLRQLVAGKADTGIVLGENKKSVFENIDVKFITHQGGCGGIRQDSALLAKLLAGYVDNPNVAGATVLSLGCQNLQIEVFKNALKEINPTLDKPVLIYEQQAMGIIDNMIKTIIKDSFIEIQKANNIQREPAPISKLKIGLECGGSDGFSGISANPTLGRVSDLVSALGGSPILAEFPELCGVEQELMDRCIDESKANKFITLMKDYEKSAIDAGSGFDLNPSPGNIKDGLITDAMKSAGAAKKGGSSPITDVKDYGEYVSQPGLNLLCTPGNDVQSTTGLVGSGANIVLFTTGLGTPTGNPIAPVIKVSSNTRLAQEMSDIIDFDTGPIIRGEKTISEMGDDLLEYIVQVASGKLAAKADLLVQDDFIPWKRGVSL